MIEQVTLQLATLGIQDEDISEYISGIIQDETMSEEEKTEVVTEFLSEATDKSTENMIGILLKEYRSLQDQKQKQETETKHKLIEAARAREEERLRKIKAELDSQPQPHTTERQLTKEEKEAREKLMRQYGYVADGSDDTTQTQDPLLSSNRNADKIKEQERIRREQMKHASDKEKERNRMLMEKQKKEKTLDKEKKKTQKGERRRM